MPTVTTTQTTDVQITPAQKVRLRRQLTEYSRLGSEIEALETKRAKTKTAVEAVQVEIGAEKIDFEGFKITLVAGGVSKKLDEKKLVAQGVTTAQIENATVYTPKKSYTLITPPKAAE